MARGITQEQVNEAADTLLRAGERPTIERVRAALGTGSPNTLIRLLDVWWSDLGKRLGEHERKLAMPDAPESVVHAASALWSLALKHAEETVIQSVAAEREQLEIDRAEADQRVASALASEAQGREAARRAEGARDAAIARVSDLDRLVAHQAQQIADLHAQREGSMAERDAALARSASLSVELRDVSTTAAAERAFRDEQLRSMEDRWLREVDRARQETVNVQQLLQREQKSVRQKEGELEQLRTVGARAERDHAAVSARLEAALAESERLHRLLAEATSRASVRDTVAPSRSKARKRK